MILFFKSRGTEVDETDISGEQDPFRPGWCITLGRVRASETDNYNAHEPAYLERDRYMYQFMVIVDKKNVFRLQVCVNQMEVMQD